MGRKNNREDKCVLEIHDENGFVGYAKTSEIGVNEHGTMMQVEPVFTIRQATKFCTLCNLQTVPMLVRALKQIYPEFTRFVLTKVNKPRLDYTTQKPEQISDDYNYEG